MTPFLFDDPNIFYVQARFLHDPCATSDMFGFYQVDPEEYIMYSLICLLSFGEAVRRSQSMTVSYNCGLSQISMFAQSSAAAFEEIAVQDF
jgi:hypothetical protein